MTINEAGDLILNAGRIVFFTGAGISTNSGVPDFRGENGLYRQVEKKYNLQRGEDLFDLEKFITRPQPFFDFSGELFRNDIKPTRCHNLLAALERQGRVSLVITQNIDGLHQKAGTERLFECHGTYDRARCLACGRKYHFREYEKELKRGEGAVCNCGGIVKPDVVFFGESLPDRFYQLWENPPQGDLLVIMGTSLNVRPASDLALKISGLMPSMIINREKTSYDNRFNYALREDLDLFADSIAKLSANSINPSRQTVSVDTPVGS